MRIDLLPTGCRAYKANLHCHSTVSDGKWTPEYIRERYMDMGYSIVAFTDHDVLIPHPELKCEGFLPLNGFEVEINDPRQHRCCHICFIGLEEENVIQPFWHRSRYLFGNAPKYRDQVRFDGSEPDYERVYDPEKISAMMLEGRNKGFFVTYNHPTWSLENYSDYSRYNGMHAMEMVNYGCLISGYEEYNSRVYDDMLRLGRRIFCIDTDDNHNIVADSFGGFTMIFAEELSYRAVTRALEQGHFYASQGPKIEALWLEDGVIHLRCSPAARISMTTGTRSADIVMAGLGKTITKASFILPKDCSYVRFTVTDSRGDKADTNAYFLDDLGLTQPEA